jgi:hypothetical protein
VANLNYDIRSGLFTFLLDVGNVDLRSAIAKTIKSTTYYRLYYDQAAQTFDGINKVDVPFIVLTILPIEPDLDTVSRFYRCWIQFLVSAPSISGAENLATLLTDLLDDSEGDLAFGTHRVIEIRRQPQINLPTVEGVANIAVQYSLIIE